MSLGKFTLIMTGFSVFPSSARLITYVSSILDLDPSLSLFKALKMS